MSDTFDPAAFLAEHETEETPNQTPLSPDQPAVSSGLEPEAFDPAAFVAEQRAEKYGTVGQQALTAVEGAAEGFLGPLAPGIERGLGVNPKDIRERKEENPITHGVAEAAGLGVGLFTGTGEAALLGKAGSAAVKGAGLAAEAGKAVSLANRIGSAVVREAVENAVYEAGSEVSKLILQDPDVSAETAAANIGLAAVLGGGGGGLLAGAISPLWKATAGDQVESTLSAVKKHLDGESMVVPEAVQNAVNTLGIEVPAELKAAMGGGDLAKDAYNTLQYAQNPNISNAVQKLEQDASEAVAKGLGIDLESAARYDKSDVGTDLREALKKEYLAKYSPQEAVFQKDAELASTIGLTDEAKMGEYGKILENSITNRVPGVDGYSLAKKWGDEILQAENVAGIDAVRTAINNDISKAYAAKDYNTALALRGIKDSLGEFVENQITRQATQLEDEGVEFASAIGKDILAEREAARKGYAEFAQMSRELLDHTGSGRFHGAKTLVQKFDSLSPEQMVSKFSPKNNAEIAPFLQKYFPETLEHIRQQELKELIKPAITNVKGEMPINFEKLAKILDNKDAGQSKLLEFALPEGARARIDAARAIMDALPKRRDSGTPGGLMKLLRDMPRNAMAAIAMAMGNDPFTGMLLGELTQKFSRDIPDAARLAFLKFLGSDQPIKSEGFKAMVDFFEATAKGESAFARAAKDVFKAGRYVLASDQFPTERDREKLDKEVTKLTEQPDKLFNTAMSDAPVGYYLPEHQGSLAKTATSALQYLQGLKPKDVQLSPLDKPIKPAAEQVARYNRALDIAQKPLIVLQRVKDGTLLPSDIQDLSHLYPGLYQRMVTKLTNEMAGAQADEEPIPYKTRVGVSLFLAQPMDSTMIPEAIQAAQTSFLPPQPPQGPLAPQGKSLKSLGKNVKSYQTPLQASEERRTTRN